MIRSTFLALSLAAVALAQAPVWGQCGGLQWTGPTTCTTGWTCVVSNPYFSQCIPATTSAPPSSTHSTTTAPPSSSSHSVTSAPPSSTHSTTTSALPPVSTGFIKTSGTRFTLNGKPYTVVGSNAYWLPLWGLSTADISAGIDGIVNSSATTIRTWGFNEVTSPSGVYFHLWNGSTPTVNTGADGLGVLDTVISLAKAKGLHVIIALTNNWGDYGGMEVYTKQILGAGLPHDTFFTNPTVIAAFKTYVKAIVTRYANEPAIMAWELMNEPRCGGTAPASATCNNTVITNWAADISAYIKSIDPNHLVAIGDEGFINQPGNFDYPYSGGIGIDFAANLQIKTLDFGTVHMYPDSWGESANTDSWGVQWIKDHATMMKAANKPVILEEFGVTPSSSRINVYTDWYNAVLSSGLTGDLVWQAGTPLAPGQAPPADPYMIWPTDPVYQLMQSHAAALAARG